MGFLTELPQQTENGIKRREAIRTVIRAKIEGMTHREASNLVDYGRNWVGERWREYKDGAFEDLIDEDMAEASI